MNFVLNFHALPNLILSGFFNFFNDSSPSGVAATLSAGDQQELARGVGFKLWPNAKSPRLAKNAQRGYPLIRAEQLLIFII
jgi:hypothetical protein